MRFIIDLAQFIVLTILSLRNGKTIRDWRQLLSRASLLVITWSVVLTHSSFVCSACCLSTSPHPSVLLLPLVDSMHDLTSKLQEVTWHTGQSNINSASTLVSPGHQLLICPGSWVTKVGHPTQHIQVLPCSLLSLLHQQEPCAFGRKKRETISYLLITPMNTF